MEQSRGWSRRASAGMARPRPPGLGRAVSRAVRPPTERVVETLPCERCFFPRFFLSAGGGGAARRPIARRLPRASPPPPLLLFTCRILKGFSACRYGFSGARRFTYASSRFRRGASTGPGRAGPAPVASRFPPASFRREECHSSQKVVSISIHTARFFSSMFCSTPGASPFRFYFGVLFVVVRTLLCLRQFL